MSENTAKLFQHPSDSLAMIMETTEGNLLVKNEFVQETTIPTSGLTELPWDGTAEAFFINAKNNAEKNLSAAEIGRLQLLVQEKKEDFDGAES